MMNQLPQVFLKDGIAFTDSRDVAKKFKKEHKNVLRDIQNLGCSSDFSKLNFELSSYQTTQNKTLPCFHMSRDGFVILAMGFTGKEAMQWKEDYIEAFNMMEAALKDNTQSGIPMELRMKLEQVSYACGLFGKREGRGVWNALGLAPLPMPKELRKAERFAVNDRPHPLINPLGFVTSLEIAAYLGREHGSVLRTIKRYYDILPRDFCQMNFKKRKYVDEQNKVQPCYHVDEMGVVLFLTGVEKHELSTLLAPYVKARTGDVTQAMSVH
jgi:Rha family phage regulatory protein